MCNAAIEDGRQGQNKRQSITGEPANGSAHSSRHYHHTCAFPLPLNQPTKEKKQNEKSTRTTISESFNYQLHLGNNV